MQPRRRYTAQNCTEKVSQLETDASFMWQVNTCPQRTETRISRCVCLSRSGQEEVTPERALALPPPMGPCGQWLRCPTWGSLTTSSDCWGSDPTASTCVVKQGCGAVPGAALPLVIDLITAGSHFPSPCSSWVEARAPTLPSPAAQVPTQSRWPLGCTGPAPHSSHLHRGSWPRDAAPLHSFVLLRHSSGRDC